MKYYEFSINRLGQVRKQKKYEYLSGKFISLLDNHHKQNPQQCLYQLTTHKERPEKMQSFWSLWIQTYAENEEHAVEIANSLRIKILSGDLPTEGYLSDNKSDVGKFKSKSEFDDFTIEVKSRTYKLIIIFQEYKLDAKLGAEIGVQVGQNAIPLLTKIPQLNLLLVDNYDNSLEIHRRKQSAIKDIAFSRFEKLQDRITWILKPSVEAAKEVEDNSLDFVYIDAMHDYDNVKNDIKAWVPKVRIGGLITGHDFTPRYKGLKKAVREIFGNNFSSNGDVWYTQKTKES